MSLSPSVHPSSITSEAPLSVIFLTFLLLPSPQYFHCFPPRHCFHSFSLNIFFSVIPQDSLVCLHAPTFLPLPSNTSSQHTSHCKPQHPLFLSSNTTSYPLPNVLTTPTSVHVYSPHSGFSRLHYQFYLLSYTFNFSSMFFLDTSAFPPLPSTPTFFSLLPTFRSQSYSLTFYPLKLFL